MIHGHPIISSGLSVLVLSSLFKHLKHLPELGWTFWVLEKEKSVILLSLITLVKCALLIDIGKKCKRFEV